MSTGFAPVYYLLGDRVAWYADKAILSAIFFMGMFLVFRHRENINRLLEGKESRLGGDKPRAADEKPAGKVGGVGSKGR